MRLIAITTDTLFDGEGAVLNALFDMGLPRLHVRKPAATEARLKLLLEQIESSYYDRVVLHDHFGLVSRFGLGGVHLNGRNPLRPEFSSGSVSLSCHSPECVAGAQVSYDYVFLSPVFDSISKEGYEHAFSHEQLLDMKSRGVINDRVVALGGVDAKTIPMAAGYGFGGVAVLGALWGTFVRDGDRDALLRRFDSLREITDWQRIDSFRR